MVKKGLRGCFTGIVMALWGRVSNRELIRVIHPMRSVRGERLWQVVIYPVE